MLEELSVFDLGVIAAARLDFSEAMTVITGETGTGKTMVLTALGLLRGQRSDPSLVRVGAKAAQAEGIVQVAGYPDALARAEEAGAVAEEGRLTLARILPAEGRARTVLGGRTVPQSVLAEVMDGLVVVHGQSDQLQLRSPAAQRDALDAFAGPAHAPLLDRYRELYEQRGAEVAHLHELESSRSRADARREELSRAIAEIDKVAPEGGEDQALGADLARLGHAEELREAVEVAYGALIEATEPDGSTAIAALAIAERTLGRAAEKDPSLGALNTRLADVTIQLDDIGSELAHYRDLLEADPARLAQGQARMAELTQLMRTYGPELDDVLKFRDQAAAELDELGAGDERIEQARKRLATIEGELSDAGARLSASRAQAAGELQDAVASELAGLAMAGARLTVGLEPLPEPGPWGCESVAFGFTAHPSNPVRPLAKAASGGELSRVMLALEVCLAARGAESGNRLPAMVFDEVDAGVGGRAAIEVGRRLSQLARHTQVIVVTHLPQVAAFAERHLVVHKETGDVVASDVREVTGEDRLRELARMFAGQEDSGAARQHAAELLALAGQEAR